MEITTQGILSLFETTKQERNTFTSDVLERIENGTADPVKVHLQLKCMEEIVKSLTGNESYKTHLIDAAEKNGKKFMAFNAEFSIKEMGTKYDYSQCNDDYLLNMLETLEKLNKEIKERQEYLKHLPAVGVSILEVEGELIKLYPPTKTSNTTVAVTLK